MSSSERGGRSPAPSLGTRGLPPRSTIALAALALGAAAAWFWYLSVFQVDDAYIVYRYAVNLARGDGFVFNPGERVEGVSCFLWALALTPFAALGLPLPSVAPVLTGLTGLAILCLLPGIAARMQGRSRVTPWDAVPSILAGSYSGFAYWSVGALETVPYTLLLVLTMRDQALERDRGRGVRSATWMGLATLTRPEAPLLAAAFAADRACWGGLRNAVRWLVLVFGFYLGVLAFRLLYFGEWLPMPYYAKTGGGLTAQVARGWAYTKAFLDSLPPLWLDSVPRPWVGGLMVLGATVFGLVKPTLRPAALIVVVVTAATILEGGDWMALFRFFVPALPFLALLWAAALQTVLSRTVGQAARLAYGVAGSLVAVFAVAWIQFGAHMRDGANGLVVNAEGYRRAHGEVARALRERARSGDTVALMDIGIIGYESGLRVIDITGLTEPAVAKAPGAFLNKEYPVEMLLARAPRFLVLVDGFPIDGRIRSHPLLQSNYRLILQRNHKANWTPPQSYVLHLYELIEANGGHASFRPVTERLR